MVAPVSIIIPTLNAADKIGPTLASLATGIGEGLIGQLIIADGGSHDSIADIADHAGATFVAAAPGRGGQLAAGAELATGPWLLFLHADTVLSADWTRSLRRHMVNDPDKAGYFRLAFDAQGLAPRLTESWANLRSRLLHLPLGDQGLFISRHLYAEIGGYPAIPLLEDVAVARRLRRRLKQIDAVATTSASRYILQGWIKRGLSNQIVLVRYFMGADPARLARRYS